MKEIKSNTETLVLKVKKHFPEVPDFKKIVKGDWIDMHACLVKYHNEEIGHKVVHDLRETKNSVFFPQEGDVLMIGLGISMEVPEGYEAHVLPRSSTYKTWGLLQTNSQGVIDNSYNGNNDMWWFPCKVDKEAKPIEFGDRVCQFRIIEKMPEISFNYVDDMENEDRGGFGSSGIGTDIKE